MSNLNQINRLMNLDLDLQIATQQPHPDAVAFKTWCEQALGNIQCPKGCQIGIRLVSIDESQALNAQYRGKNKPTNVLSFPFELPDNLPPEAAASDADCLDKLPKILGDLVICPDIVQQEAQEQGKAESDHWAHLTIHGTLHLLGYDHQTETEAEQMETLEIHLLKQLGIHNPYLENDI